MGDAGDASLSFYGPERGRRAVEAIRALHALCADTGGTVDIFRERWWIDSCTEDFCGFVTRCGSGGYTGLLVCRCPAGSGWDVLDGCRACSLPYTCDDIAARLRYVRSCSAHTDCQPCHPGFGACECSMTLAAAGPLAMHARFADLENLARLDRELGCRLDVCGCAGGLGCEDGQCAYDAWDEVHGCEF